jgi:hypothetical protein
MHGTNLDLRRSTEPNNACFCPVAAIQKSDPVPPFLGYAAERDFKQKNMSKAADPIDQATTSATGLSDMLDLLIPFKI